MTQQGALDCDVIVLGGGPVGLFLACELGAYGVSCEVYEQAATTSVHPKANTHGARSLELYRRHGIAERLRSTGWPSARATDVVYVTRMLGHELGRVALPSPAAALDAARGGSTRWPTPEPQLRASQLMLEPLLRARAQSFASVALHFSAAVTAFRDRGTHVEVDVRPATTRRAQYLVACDGAKSFARAELGLRFAGEGGLDLGFMGGTMVTTYFRAPTLHALLSIAPAWQYWILNPDRRNLIVSLDGGEHFVLHHQLRPDEALETFDFSAALTAAVGRAIPHEQLSAAPWRAGRALVAEHYGRGRVALAGDAAHLFTPTGGLGVNTGIEDVANLSWKLWAQLRGWAGPALLPSYERERKPVAEHNTRFALSLAQAVSACPIDAEMEHGNDAGRLAREAAGQHIARVAHNEFDHPGLQLGSRYDLAGLVCSTEASSNAPSLEYVPTFAPGGRVPHFWLDDGRSSLDLCGHGFVLLVLSDFDASSLGEAASARGIPLVVHTLSRPDIATRFGVSAALVRPDQIVAWSGTTPPDADRVLDLVTGRSTPGRATFDVEHP